MDLVDYEMGFVKMNMKKFMRADHLASFMLGAVSVQIGYLSMDTRDSVDKFTPTYSY